MSLLVNGLYENSLLAQGSYAILNKGMGDVAFIKALSDEQTDSFSSTQSAYFIQQYEVVDSLQNTDAGFSATLFPIKGTDLFILCRCK